MLGRPWLLFAVGPVPDHGFGFGFVLLGEDNVRSANGNSTRLPQPFLCTTTSDLVGASRCVWCSSCCWHLIPPEPVWVSFVFAAGMPWYATSALPEPNKALSFTGLAPSSVVEFVQVELLLGVINYISAGWAV